MIFCINHKTKTFNWNNFSLRWNSLWLFRITPRCLSICGISHWLSIRGVSTWLWLNVRNKPCTVECSNPNHYKFMTISEKTKKRIENCLSISPKCQNLSWRCTSDKDTSPWDSFFHYPHINLSAILQFRSISRNFKLSWWHCLKVRGKTHQKCT